jgi:hypothetical protein
MRWLIPPALAAAAFTAWVVSLPRLDPGGREDSSAAVVAMIEGRAVRNVSSGWVMTRTGWPFFERYSPPETQP